MRSDAIGLFWQDIPATKRAAAPKRKRTPPKPDWLLPTYLPNLQEAINFSHNCPIMDEWELFDLGTNQREVLVFDIEIYPNYFLAAFKHITSGRICYVESDEDGIYNEAKLEYILKNFVTVGFNSINFDLPISALALANKPLSVLMDATKRIIEVGENWREVLKSYKVKRIDCNHIDLMEVAPLRANLKIYNGRLHGRRMQDLPFQPGTNLTPEQKIITRWYCFNDLAATELMYSSLSEQLQLRVVLSQRYNIDLRSKSDAQIAEHVISSEIVKLTRERVQRPTIDPGTVYRYNTPAYMQFQTPLLQNVLRVVQEAKFIVADHGSIELPPEFNELDIRIGNSKYTLQIGGLHSTEKKASHFADEDTELWDYDVTSYYPRIILNQKIYPMHLGPIFLPVYNAIVEERVAAKARGDKITAGSLKIVANGSYGKLGSKYSNLYAPNLLVQVTMTGQLSLLLLIEWLEMSGIPVVSANTDGIVIKPKKNQAELMRQIVSYWEQQTNFQMEASQYKAICSRDVNNYIAVKDDGSVKAKGAYANPWKSDKDKSEWMHKNPTYTVCTDAVAQFLSKGIPIHKTIRECSDVRMFVSVRSVKGGAVKVWESSKIPEHKTKQDLVELVGFREYYGGTWLRPGESDRSAHSLDDAYTLACNLLATPEKTEYLGKSVRWYYAKDHIGEIVYAGSGNKVPKSDGAVPLMELPDSVPEDIDREWYIREAERMLAETGYA